MGRRYERRAGGSPPRPEPRRGGSRGARRREWVDPRYAEAMMNIDDRLARLEQRLRQVEDELAVLRLLAAYGPLADAGAADGAAALWAADGEYDVEGWRMRSRGAIAEMLRSDAHWELLTGGCSHFF